MTAKRARRVLTEQILNNPLPPRQRKPVHPPTSFRRQQDSFHERFHTNYKSLAQQFGGEGRRRLRRIAIDKTRRELRTEREQHQAQG